MMAAGTQTVKQQTLTPALPEFEAASFFRVQIKNNGNYGS